MNPTKPATDREQLLAAVPMFVRFFRGYQALDDEGRSVVSEMATFVERDLFPQIERDYAADVIVAALFPQVD
ncbi:MAG: hypothetical protein EXS05_23035 [Planctomycetaceae bacterium]|nr:hypothetical protein [Planctomycetaceae bacterium]